jgi:TorA maturation chaperone TorD
MTTDDPTTEIADLYAFLSSVIADPPDETTIERLKRERLPAEASPQAIETGFRLLSEWLSGVRDPADAAAELERAHTALFVGPRPKLQVHESWYANDYLGEPLAAIRSTYRDLGIRPSEELREEADHAAVELAALEMLARDGADDYRRAFLTAHGWWLPDLATDLQEMTDEPFYEGVGWLLEGALQADAYLLDIDPDDLSPGYDRPPSAPTGE